MYTKIHVLKILKAFELSLGLMIKFLITYVNWQFPAGSMHQSTKHPQLSGLWIKLWLHIIQAVILWWLLINRNVINAKHNFFHLGIYIAQITLNVC